MSHFIGNDKYTVDAEKIVIIRWKCKDSHGLSYTEINFIEGFEEHLYFTDDDDFQLINELRNSFGFEPLPRVK